MLCNRLVDGSVPTRWSGTQAAVFLAFPTQQQETMTTSEMERHQASKQGISRNLISHKTTCLRCKVLDKVEEIPYEISILYTSRSIFNK